MFDYNDYYRQPDRQFGFPPGLPSGTPPFGGPQFGQPPFGGLPSGQFPGGGGTGAPSSPPPSFTPSQAQAQTLGGPGVLAVDPGAIRPCRFRFVYLWLTTGQQFWAWLVFVGPRSVSGWRWTGFRWVFFGIDLRLIRSFICY